jgi:RimJ/RimL family protein N-acetyltransferase
MDADSWLHWARRGWSENAHFTFAVLDQWGDVSAACDIKSNSVTDAEIGYWCSTSASGIMTNAVRAMIEVALHAGFQSFIAYTRPGNVRSIAVLGRLGFSCSTVGGVDGRFRHHYCPHGSAVTHS